jgi:hypothetical protein
VVRRLLARECELCGQAADTQAHQVRKLSDLGQQGQEQPAWAALMAKMRRKTLMVCPDCHDGIHKGRQLRATESPESRMR